MQSLEEEALLKGTLAIEAAKKGSSILRRGEAGEKGRGEGEVGAEKRQPSPSGDEDEPQTDGDDTDGYSDQVPARWCTTCNYIKERCIEGTSCWCSKVRTN